MKNLMELRNLYELDDLEFDSVSVYFFMYDIQKRLVYVPENTRTAFECKEYYENMPKSFADEFVAEEYWQAFYKLYDDCHNGIDNRECLFEDRDKKYCITVKLQITQRDNNGAPLLAIGIIENQTAIKSIRINKDKELRTRDFIIHKLYDEFSAVSYADLQENTIVDYRVDYLWDLWDNPNKENLSFSERILRFSEYCVIEEDRNTFQNGMLPDKIMERIKSELSYSFEYKVKVKNDIHYYRTKIIADNENQDKNRFVLISFRNIDEEKKQQIFLEETLKYAEHASRAKTSFLSNMSHDMRTPMNAIIGFTALASAHLEDKERVKEYLEKISVSSNHLLSLINDILDMSRIESGKLVLNESPENLADILHEIRSMVQSQVNSKQLDFFIDTCDVKDELIYCDKMRLKQILLNIFGNAVKYTNPGGTVSVRIVQKENRNKDYGNYEFHIKDNGKGMSKEFLEHIFEPFEREEKKEFDSNAGTGLGLSIVKNIVDMMNGKIDVFSEKGKGSEFVVHLSFKLQDGREEEYDFSRIQGFRALVVDDDFHTCDTVTRMLKSIGMRPEFSMYGKEAVLKAWQAYELDDEFHVYIIDWMMPDMNGLEVVRRIRKEVGDSVPIIILTAYDWDGIKDEARQAGVTAICEKPLFMSNLKKIIANSCGEQKLSAFEDVAIKSANKDFKGKKVLLVEDIEINREIAFEILSEAGFNVFTAENGEEAVDMVKAAQVGDYDVILMDIRMPKMNGYEATKVIRSMDSPYSSIPIIAMTANAFEDDMRLSFQSGMNEHISKPLNIELLFEVLGKVL